MYVSPQLLKPVRTLDEALKDYMVETSRTSNYKEKWRRNTVAAAIRDFIQNRKARVIKIDNHR